MKFIYVFSDKDKAKLLTYEYILLNEDRTGNLYIFKDDEKRPMNFDIFEQLDKYVMSDVLIF